MLKQCLVTALLAGAVGSTCAAPIFAATSATVDSGGPGFGNIADTFNQAGLLSGYVSGVTDFDAYVASNPLHSTGAGEWFSGFGGSATVTYDLGTVRMVQSLALWNEEQLGITAFNLLYSTDGSVFLPLLLGQLPANNPNGINYGPQVFEFDPTGLRFVRLDMFSCPQPEGTVPVCGLGEVAFEAVSNGGGNGEVPEPGSIALTGLGIVGLAMARRRALRAGSHKAA